MKRYTILSLMVLILFFAVQVYGATIANVVYINGIQNTREDVEESRRKIKNILAASENHSEDAKDFSVSAILNPIGFFGSTDGSDLDQDLMELFLLKTSEELYAEDFYKIMLPYNESSIIDVDAAKRIVLGHLNDMTPGADTNFLEAEGLISDKDMAHTQEVVTKLVNKVEDLGSAVVVAHSEGNMIVNLAYARIVAEHGDNAFKMIKVVNVANTSMFCLNNLNFTHGGDAALYSAATPPGEVDFSLENLPEVGSWRTTPECNHSDCNFVIAPPTFGGYPGSNSFLNHAIVGTYLSTDIILSNENNQYDFFSPGAERFIDRFEDFVYAAAESLDVANRSDVDNDGDGYSVPDGDCDDNDDSIHPGAIEVCGDGVDQDCDGVADFGCGVADSVINILSPACASYFDEGEEIVIAVEVGGNIVSGDVVVEGETFDFGDGGVLFRRVLNNAGDIKITASGVDAVGNNFSAHSNIMVLDMEGGEYIDGKYVAACLKVTELSAYSVELDASATRGVSVVDGVVDVLVPEEGDVFYWHWEIDKWVRDFVSPRDPLAYHFTKYFATPGKRLVSVEVDY